MGVRKASWLDVSIAALTDSVNQKRKRFYIEINKCNEICNFIRDSYKIRNIPVEEKRAKL